MRPLSKPPPTRTVVPSADNATALPCLEAPTGLVPTSFPRCAHVATEDNPLKLRVKIQAAPTPLLSPGPPTTAVLPSADKAADLPGPSTAALGGTLAPAPTSF